MKSYVEKLAPAFPYLVRSGNTFCAGDFDGDGRVEVASYCSANNTLNILSYFTYADASPMWIAATDGQLVNAWGCVQTIPAGPNVVNAWQLSSDDSYLAVPFSGSAASLVLFNPSSKMIGVAEWSGNQMQLAWSSQGTSAPYCGLASDDQFFAADLDGDGNDELVQYSPSNQYLFGMLWTGAGFTVISDSHGTAGSWTLSPTDTLLAAHLVSGTADQIVALNFEKQAAGVLTYGNGQLNGPSVALPGTMPSGSTAFAADVDGDGLDEIVIWSAENATFPLVIKWNGAGFDSIIDTSTQFVAYGNMLPLRVLGSKTLLFGYALTPSSCLVGIATVTGSGADMWRADTIPGYVGLNPSDVFCVADIDGDGNDELVMTSMVDGWLFALKWTGSELFPLSSVQTAAPGWGVDLLLGAPKTPLTGPPFGPSPFTGNQETIYQQISQSLYPAIAKTVAGDGCSNSDIRSCYQYLGAPDFTSLQGSLNAYVSKLGPPSADDQAVIDGLSYDFIYGYISDTLDSTSGSNIRIQYTSLDYAFSTDWANYAKEITGGFDVTAMPPLPGANAAAWSAMSNQLAGEMKGLASVLLWSGPTSMGYLNTQLLATHKAALETAIGNVDQTIEPTSPNPTGLFWWTNCIDAVLWGLAAIPMIGEAVPVLPMLLSMAASMFPAFMTNYQPAVQPPAEQIPYAEFAGQLDQAFIDASDVVANKAAAIIGDQVLLPLVGALLNGTLADGWLLTTVEIDAMAAAAAAPARLQYYSIFIPMRFNVLIWEKSARKGPYYCELQDQRGHAYYEPVSVGAPLDTYLTQPNGDGTYNVYLLCEGNEPGPQLSYPVPALITDVFTTLNVQPLDFVTGVGMWSVIPRTVLSLQC